METNKFSAVKSVLAIIVAGIGVIASFVTLAPVFSVEKLAQDLQWAFPLSVLGLSFLMLLCALFANVYLQGRATKNARKKEREAESIRKDYEKLSAVWSEASSNMHDILHDGRMTTNLMQEHITKSSIFLLDYRSVKQESATDWIIKSEDRIKSLKQDFADDEMRVNASFDLLLTKVADTFGTFTGDKCSACIKLIKRVNADGEDRDFINDEDDLNNVIVKTYKRDSNTRGSRDYIDKEKALPSYHLNKNSAFYKIYESSTEKSWYMENDLKSLGSEYRNAHQDWAKHYNACLVLPIRMPKNSGSANLYIGFICVDNMKGNFTHDHRMWLAGIADNLFLMFTLFFEKNKQVNILSGLSS